LTTKKSYFFDDNCDNIPRQSTSCRGEGFYFQQLKQHKPTTLPLTTTQFAAWNILLERPREFLSPFGRGRNVVGIVIKLILSFLTHVFVILHAGGGVKELRDKRYELRVLD
jgi:hypothetical protein